MNKTCLLILLCLICELLLFSCTTKLNYEKYSFRSDYEISPIIKPKGRIVSIQLDEAECDTESVGSSSQFYENDEITGEIKDEDCPSNSSDEERNSCDKTFNEDAILLKFNLNKCYVNLERLNLEHMVHREDEAGSKRREEDDDSEVDRYSSFKY